MITELSIVLLSWNSLPMLRRCLASLSGVMERPEVEVIWVDNGSADGSADFVREVYPAVRAILLERNFGVAAGRNQGLKVARGEYILILDDDTEASAEAIDALLNHLKGNPGCGIAACALVDSDGCVQQSFKPYPGLGVKVRNVLRSKLGLKDNPAAISGTVLHPCYVIGACQMFRGRFVKEIGLLDDNIFYGPEDADYCMRIHAAGYSVDYLPQVSILHHWRRITSRSLTSAGSRRHIRALLYFWKKYRRLF